MVEQRRADTGPGLQVSIPLLCMPPYAAPCCSKILATPGFSCNNAIFFTHCHLPPASEVFICSQCVNDHQMQDACIDHLSPLSNNFNLMTTAHKVHMWVAV